MPLSVDRLWNSVDRPHIFKDPRVGFFSVATSVNRQRYFQPPLSFSQVEIKKWHNFFVRARNRAPFSTLVSIIKILSFEIYFDPKFKNNHFTIGGWLLVILAYNSALMPAFRIPRSYKTRDRKPCT